MIICIKCGAKARSRSLCSAHYQAALKTQNLPPRRRALPAPKDKADDLINQAVRTNSRDCIEWPWARIDGYGAYGTANNQIRVHRMVCERAHGEPFDGAEAAHRCGNRACINRNHLRWATAKENGEDRSRDMAARKAAAARQQMDGLVLGLLSIPG